MSVQIEDTGRKAIADAWYEAVVETGFVPFPPAEIRRRLLLLLDRVLAAAKWGEASATEAARIGAGLAELHCLQPEVLERTLGILHGLALDNYAPGETQLHQATVLALASGVAGGYYSRATQMILGEQEAVRQALIAELQDTERALRQAHHELEKRVAERTEELVAANAELRRQIGERQKAEDAHRESEERFRDLVENMSDVVYALDLNGVVTYISPSVSSMLGYEPDEMEGRPFHEFVFERDLTKGIHGFRRVLDSGDQRNEYRVVSKSGDVRCVRSASRPTIDGGTIVGVQGLIVDITDRRRAEEALRESESRYRAVVEAQAELICRFRPDGTVILLNDAYRRFFFLTPGDLDQTGFMPFMTEEERSKFSWLLERLKPDQPTLTLEHQSILPDGRMPWLQWTLRASFDESGAPAGIQAVGRDITERKLADEALKASEARWRSLVQSAPEIILTVDRNWQISFINRVPDSATISTEGVIGIDVTRYVPEEYRPQVAQALETVMGAGTSEYCEVPFVSTAGFERWYALHVAPIKQDGEIVSAIMIARDISRRREIDEMKDNLIRDVSHELRTPLAKVQMSLELLSELLAADTLDRDRASRIGALTTMNVQRLLETVEGILDLSQLEAGGLVHHRDAVSLGEVVDEVGRYMEALVQAKGLDLVWEIPWNLPLVDVDRSQIFRVLLNLVDNAIKFSDRGRIQISARQAGVQVELAVQDEGQGIDPQNLERVFDRFFQEKTRYQGVGVGLTICRAIVEGHGGRIWAESRGRDQGVLVCLTLPISCGEAEDR